MVSRDVNDLFWTLEASAYFGRHFLRFYRMDPAVLQSKMRMLRGPIFTRSLLGKPFTFVFAGHRFGHCDSVSADIERENALPWTIGSVRTYLRGCLHNSRYYVAEF